jgi:prepilin-type N-terminal cleavage/methylation domain-containing protein
MTKHRICRTRLHSREDGFSMMEMVVVLAVMGTIAAIAMPVITRALASMRLNGAIRSISNATAATKTKAGAQFTRARLYLDRGANSYHIETYVPGAVPGTGNWVVDGGTTFLPVNVTFNFNPVGTPPANTQLLINHAPACLDNNTPPLPIANTSCVVFNSRGIPIDNGGGPTTADAVYISDGTAVLAVTVSATGLIGVWATPPTVAPAWTIS